jgi:hypothetical protein
MNRKLTKQHRAFLLQIKWKKEKRLQEITAAFTKKFPSVKPPIKQETHNLIARGEKIWKCAVIEYIGRPGSAR